MVNLTIKYESGVSVSLDFPNTVEARRELIARTGNMSRQGNGARGILLADGSNKIVGSYAITEGEQQ